MCEIDSATVLLAHCQSFFYYHPYWILDAMSESLRSTGSMGETVLALIIKTLSPATARSSRDLGILGELLRNGVDVVANPRVRLGRFESLGPCCAAWR